MGILSSDSSTSTNTQQQPQPQPQQQSVAHQCCYREQFAYSLYCRFREPKLYSLAVNGHWDKIPARCQSHPKEVSFRHKYPPNDTALHRILRTNLSTALLVAADTTTTTICAQLEGGDASTTVCGGFQEKDASSTQSSSHWSLAAAEEIKLAAMDALLSTNRQIAAIPDAFGRTPLHLACMNFTEPPTNTTTTLNGSSKSLQQQNHHHQYHLGDTIAALKLLQANPKAASLMDVEKRTPLHYLIARSESWIPIKVLHALVEAHPEAVLVRDACKETPHDILHRRSNELGMEQCERVRAILQPIALGEKDEQDFRK